MYHIQFRFATGMFRLIFGLLARIFAQLLSLFSGDFYKIPQTPRNMQVIL